MGKPKIRFKGFTEDWEQRKLGELMEITSVKRIHQSDWTNSGVRFLRARDIVAESKKEEVTEPLFISQEKYEEYSALSGKVKIGDLLVTGVGTIGIPMLINSEEPLYFKDGNIIWFKNEGTIDGSFFYHSFNGDNIQQFIRESAGTGTVGTYTIESGKKTPINLPHQKEEQAKLGEFFSNLDNLITLHQRKCDETKKLKKYMLQKMFPQNGMKIPEIRFEGFTGAWEQRKVGDLVINHNAGVYISKEEYGSGTNVIGVGNIYNSDIFDGEIFRLGPVNDSKYLLEENDLIYGESSLVPEGIARTICVGKNGVGSAFAWHTRRVKLNNNLVNSHFATLQLNYHSEVRKYLMSVSTQTALTGMTTEGYFGATLFLPTVMEQNKISRLFQQIDNLITLHQRKCDELVKIKKYMLQNMFV